MTVFSCLPVQVYRSHVRVFKSLRLHRAQKEALAALWYGWKRRRHALNKEFAAALSLLSSCLPSQAPCELPGLAAWGAQPDAAQTASTLPNAASGHRLENFGLMLLYESTDADLGIEDACAAEDLGGQPRAHPAPSAERGEVVDCSSLASDMHSSSQRRGPDAYLMGELPEVSDRWARVWLLGASGQGMASAQRALSALLDVHRTDDLVLREYSAHELLGTWGMHEVLLPLCIRRASTRSTVPITC